MNRKKLQEKIKDLKAKNKLLKEKVEYKRLKKKTSFRRNLPKLVKIKLKGAKINLKPKKSKKNKIHLF